jgi:hypothetical protein
VVVSQLGPRAGCPRAPRHGDGVQWSATKRSRRQRPAADGGRLDPVPELPVRMRTAWSSVSRRTVSTTRPRGEGPGVAHHHPVGQDERAGPASEPRAGPLRPRWPMSPASERTWRRRSSGPPCASSERFRKGGMLAPGLGIPCQSRGRTGVPSVAPVGEARADPSTPGPRYQVELELPRRVAIFLAIFRPRILQFGMAKAVLNGFGWPTGQPQKAPLSCVNSVVPHQLAPPETVRRASS